MKKILKKCNFELIFNEIKEIQRKFEGNIEEMPLTNTTIAYMHACDRIVPL